jgi:hypothetical protein
MEEQATYSFEPTDEPTTVPGTYPELLVEYLGLEKQFATLLALLQKAESRLAEEQAATAEQERQMLELVKELKTLREGVSEELSFLHDSVGNMPDFGLMEAICAAANRLGATLLPFPADLTSPACLGDCTTCQKGEGEPSDLLNLLLHPSQQVNPHKDPNFWGCWGNAECPCDSKCPEDCPLHLPDEDEAAPTQGEEGGVRG